MIPASSLQELNPPQMLSMPIGHGTAGWTGDDVVEDMDGDVTLIKVTLFMGHELDKPTSDEGFANGYQILVQPSFPLWFIPKKGQRCIIAFPEGDFKTPGNGIIIACPGPSPKRGFKKTQALMDFTGYNLTIQAKSISLIGNDPDAGTSVMSVAKGKCQMQSGGSGFFVSDQGDVTMKSVGADGTLKSCVVLAQDSVSIVDAAGMAAVKLKGGNLSLSGNQCAIGCGSIGLGITASPAHPCLTGFTGAAGVPSTSVFVGV